MKIKSLHTVSAITSKGYGCTFSHTNHNLMFSQALGGFLIDSTTFVPMHNVSEVVFFPKEVGVSIEDKSIPIDVLVSAKQDTVHIESNVKRAVKPKKINELND